MNIWPAMALVLLFGLAIGFINGITVVKTRLPSFIVTLATFFILQGVNAAGTLKLTGHDRDPGHRHGAAASTRRARFFAGDLTHYDFKVKVLWWIGHHDRRRLAAREDAFRQLDLQRRRRAERGAQRRRPGRAHEDHALHDDLRRPPR